MHRQRYKLPKAVRGAVAVELALLLVPLLILTFTAAEYGRALYQYNTLVKAVRDSARHLSQFDPTDTNAYSKEVSNAKCLVVYGNPTCIGQVLAPGLTANMVSINPITTTATAGTSTITLTLVEVKITGYIFNFLLDPLALLDKGQNSLTFNNIRATMRQL
ncbi:TadE/TadG family type IV pilus assembly protein [Nitrosomonas sp. Is37]|uniref:TadE/TadG family type IV pilus assembly protein n=1 Tax=Nitrosomonas sp. Is37 TaxID=3080535 RepID=UPI00294B1A62|nr:TadE/TadG family type IV pilus assembly protein [Nitrosomonas sp. Is37]MDV6343371.1 TadE/TadG family type IV pilus assembly protein [Nitrosomonas sp. Is37]